MLDDILYIIIPAYNEESNIENVIQNWYPYIEKLGKESRLVVIDDGSKDMTYSLISKLKDTFPQLIPITKSNSGHGATVLYGYKYAIEQLKKYNDRNVYIFQTDSDGQTDPNDFIKFWSKRNEKDVIIGYRNHRKDGISRIIVTKVLKLVLFLIFHLNIVDANTPFRLMKINILEQYICKVPENFNLANVMLTVLFVKNDVNVEFIPITFEKRQGGVNSINIPRIIKIGIQAIKDFTIIKKTL